MKLLSLTLICTLMLASLPAKVWACGFSLCPMEKQQEQEKQAMASMPCHQDAAPVQPADKTGKSHHLGQESACPCPAASYSAFLGLNLEQVDNQNKHFKVNPNYSLIANIDVEVSNGFSPRPPPFTYTSGSFRAKLQVFLI